MSNISFGLSNVYYQFTAPGWDEPVPLPGAVTLASTNKPKLPRQDIRKLRRKYDPLAEIGTCSCEKRKDSFVVRCFVKKTYEVIGDFEVRTKDLRERTWMSDLEFLAKVKAYEYLQEHKEEN